MNETKILKKPDWIRIKLPDNNSISKMKKLLRSHHHCTVCEEAACPNLAECFNKGTATFLIMGNACTRNCSFCNVKHSVPTPLDPKEPQNLADAITEMKLNYVVITSVTRDDLPDGGATHYCECIHKIREAHPQVRIEILVPDFKGCQEKALTILSQAPCDIFNHNIETAPRLYDTIRPQASYKNSLLLLQRHKELFPTIPTKSGMMVGLGETDEEIEQVMSDLRKHDIDMLTMGQYLQPSLQHTPVRRYVHPTIFEKFAALAYKMGFKNAACGPLIRSSYCAEQQVSN